MSIPKDKLLHIGVGFIIGAAGAILNPFIGVALAAAAGVAKEVYDKQSGSGTVEALDAIATLGGGIAGAGFVYLVMTITMGS